MSSSPITPTAESPRVPTVGERAPDFAIPDSSGTMRRLDELAATGPLVVLFYRGHW